MKFSKHCAVVIGVSALVLSGCTGHKPVIDYRMSNKTMAEYERDLAECQSYAGEKSVGQDTVLGTLGGAAVGAALGAAVGAVAGSPGSGAAMGAAIGGIGTGAAVGTGTALSQKDIINRCMAGRGYRVLE
ncbi:hypothetical protein IHV25_09755 [Phaeovibrio sulfidiphilus]|uniref:Glycine-zipper-containing OmpA-like membrane domain-containing protein n=1 Tax=Phaeovibrio sulfidiphilus TaxID=1220600 RepID=A0A8J6YK53_9PROT|nr:hypothetical protein [Phaeovibrio sulfidiphilus]MBE1237926.1 hypothetical protein [Phaeovibrio sulfidiphilus]